MAISLSNNLLLHLLFVLSLAKAQSPLSSSPYLSPSTFFPNYHQMLKNFKIHAYETPENFTFPTSSSASLFHTSLLQSPFLTTDPERAHLFYLSLPTESPRSISRSIRTIRSVLPYWNRTLGADHFFLSRDGIGVESDRNLVELKKNSIQISPFPTIQGRFVPHKDLTLPPLFSQNLPILSTKPRRFLAFYGGTESPEISTVLDELRGDPQFQIESKPLDPADLTEKMYSSRFCLFHYGVHDQDLAVGQALGLGCVPLVISGRPILDLPFSDVLRWSEIAVFVGLRGGAREARRAMERTCGERYERMREAGAKASKHFNWTRATSQPYDSFHTVMYQLWLRRHTIRYALWKRS